MDNRWTNGVSIFIHRLHTADEQEVHQVRRSVFGCKLLFYKALIKLSTGQVALNNNNKRSISIFY